MKENYDNKSLVKVNGNIFSRIRNCFLKLFGYKEKSVENNIDINYINKEANNKPIFLESIKVSENGDTNIFDLQRKYENGDLKVSDMSKEEYSKIEDLYNRQIENLVSQIKCQKTKLSTN